MTQTLDIKFFREARGWSQARLAAELGVDQSTISRLESGGEPRLFVVHALERLAGLYPVEPIDASPSEAATSPTQDTQS